MAIRPFLRALSVQKMISVGFLSPNFDQTMHLMGTASRTSNTVCNSNSNQYQLTSGQLPSAEEHPFFYVGVFACIGLGVVFVDILGQITLAFGSYRGSKRMFKSLIESVTFAPMRWYDVTPIGMIRMIY